jgi:hypothetical protein
MQTIAAKNYAPLSALNQLRPPMNAGAPIPPDDSARLPAFVLKRLDPTPCMRRTAHAAKGGEGGGPAGGARRRSGGMGSRSRRTKGKGRARGRAGVKEGRAAAPRYSRIARHRPVRRHGAHPFQPRSGQGARTRRRLCMAVTRGQTAVPRDGGRLQETGLLCEVLAFPFIRRKPIGV